MSNNSFSDQSKIYSEQINFWNMDIHTAASLGDVSFFVKYDVGQEKKCFISDFFELKLSLFRVLYFCV